jgi:hypoxanthine-guanine phosphoribosyltransferase
MNENYDADRIVRIARRCKGKRQYLIVNPLQGKHLPVSPLETIEMMEHLGRMIREHYNGESSLFIGFAETATAIGAVIARMYNDSRYIQTTRENLEGASFIYFSEEHSHATEQKLCIDNWEILTNSISHIVFVEDEISTGKTILNIAAILKKKLDKEVQFSAVSLINAMDERAMRMYEEAGIDLIYLLHIDNNGFDERALSMPIEQDRLYDCRSQESSAMPVPDIPIIYISGKSDPRRGVFMNDYGKACYNLVMKVEGEINILNTERTKRILFLGTEECMFPALNISLLLYVFDPTLDICMHATTRTPIALSQNGPVKEGFRLRSVYDDERETYLYNLEQYDIAVVVTDTENTNPAFADIQKALKMRGCEKVIFVQWRNEPCG